MTDSEPNFNFILTDFLVLLNFCAEHCTREYLEPSSLFESQTQRKLDITNIVIKATRNRRDRAQLYDACLIQNIIIVLRCKQEIHAVAEKPRYAACFCLNPITFRLLLFYIHCIKADMNVKL